jgi:hypothetical protein
MSYSASTLYTSLLPISEVGAVNQLDGAYILLRVDAGTYETVIMTPNSGGDDFQFFYGNTTVGAASVFLCKRNHAVDTIAGRPVYNLFQVTNPATTPPQVRSYSVNHDGQHLHQSNDGSGDNNSRHLFTFRDDGINVITIGAYDDGWTDIDYLSPDPGQNFHCSSNSTPYTTGNNDPSWRPALPHIVIQSPYVQFYQTAKTQQYLCCTNNYSSGSKEQQVCANQFNLPAQCSTVMNTLCSNVNTAFVDGSSAGIDKSISAPCVSYCSQTGVNCNTILNTSCTALHTQMINVDGQVDFFAKVPDCGCFVPQASSNFCTTLASTFQSYGIAAPTCTVDCTFVPCTNSGQKALYFNRNPNCPDVSICIQSLSFTNNGTVNGNLSGSQQAACGINTSTGTGTGTNTSTNTNTGTQSSSTDFLTIGLIVAGVLLFICVIAFLLYRRTKSPTVSAVPKVDHHAAPSPTVSAAHH